MIRFLLSSPVMSAKENVLFYQSRNLRGRKSTYEGLDRMMKVLNVKEEEIMKEDFNSLHFDEEDYDDHLNLSDELQEQGEREQKIQKRLAKKNIIRKKHFKEERHNNLLKWAAKEQIRFLHQQDPVEWTPGRLAESFPIDLEGVKRLLRNNFKLKTEEDIKKHDSKVEKNWKLLNSGENKSSSSELLWMQRKFSKENYDGNKAYPVPKKASPTKSVSVTGEIGELSRIVHKQQSSSTTNQTKDIEVDELPCDDINDITSATTYQRRTYMSPHENEHVTANVFEENIKKQQPKSILDYEYKSWIRDIKTNTKKKEISLMPVDENVAEEHKVIKKYANQRKIDDLTADSSIEKPLRLESDFLDEDKQGEIKVNMQTRNNSVYDKYGRFLYKIPR